MEADSSEQSWVDLTTLMEVAFVIFFEECLTDGLTLGLSALHGTSSLEGVFAAKTVTGDEDI